MTTHCTTALLALALSLAFIPAVNAADTEEVSTRPLTTLTDAELAELMKDANQAMREQQYNRAITYYNRLVEMPDNAYRRDAIELLGLAHERNGQLQKAKQTYEYYLQLYPEGEGAERVRQRLAGLTTARWKAPPKLRETKQEQETKPWRVYGSVYQYYYRNESTLEGQDSIVNQSDLTTGLDISARGEVSGLNINSRVAGSYFHDFEDIYGNDRELSYLYLDISRNGNAWSGRLGRQRAYGGGVLGRFDGLSLGIQPADAYRLNLVAGYPVESTRDVSVNSERNFYGINLDMGPWSQYWHANTYFIQQQQSDLIDRQAIGAELRYNHPQRSLYTLVDYDIHFSELNIFTTQASYTTAQKTTYTLLLDRRNAPSITANNALIGRAETSLQALQQLYSEAEIRDLALDRTATNSLVSLGVSKPFADDYRWDMDINSNKLSSTPASGGVAATEGTAVEYFLSNRLTVHDLFIKGDVNVVGLRLTDMDNGNSASLLLNGLYPTKAGLRINPRLQYLQHNYSDSDDSETTISTALRLEYYWGRNYSMEFEAGVDWTEQKLWFGNQNYRSQWLNLGYRIDF